MPSPTPSLVAALSGPAGAGESEAMAAARAFLDGAALSGALTDEVGEALCEALTRRGDAARLSVLAAGREKALAKRARRGLHLLRARGVQTEIPVGGGGHVAPAADEVSAPPSLLSTTLRDGERLLWYVRAVENGVEVHQARMTELEGLTRFEVAIPTRREWREAESELMADDLLSAVRVPGGYARWLLEEAWQRAATVGRTAPRKYAEVRHLLERAVPPEHHPAHAAVGAPSTERDFARVLALPETRSWIPDEEMARKAYLEIEVVATSALVIDEAQRREQMQAILRRCCDEALAGPWRARLQRRLLDTGYLIARLPTRPHHDRARDHARDAALCVAAAAQVADASLAGEQQPVARGLFERLIPSETTPSEPPAPASGLIVTP